MGLPKCPNAVFSLCGKGFCLGKSLDLGSSTSQMLKTQMQQGKMSVGFWKSRKRKMLKKGIVPFRISDFGKLLFFLEGSGFYRLMKVRYSYMLKLNIDGIPEGLKKNRKWVGFKI